VEESSDKKNLENTGAPALLREYNGQQQGIPFWVIIDKNGRFLADSRLHSDNGKVTGNNVCCPSKPDEVTYFIEVLKKTSHLNNAQLVLIQKRFQKIGQ